MKRFTFRLDNISDTELETKLDQLSKINKRNMYIRESIILRNELSKIYNTDNFVELLSLIAVKQIDKPISVENINTSSGEIDFSSFDKLFDNE